VPDVDAALWSALATVAELGAPAQRAKAQRLAEILASTPDQAVALAAAEQLVDAYLNDPYLERG
jgi:hypothetical protein